MFCNTCTNQTCLKTGKPCKEVEKHLKSQGIKSANWIRPEYGKKDRSVKGRWREVPFSALSTINEDKNPYINPE